VNLPPITGSTEVSPAPLSPPFLSHVHRSPLLHREMPGLDVLRGIAVVAVVCHHGIRPSAAVGLPNTPAVARLITLTAPGFLGVNLFFVLSGFLITGILLDTRTRSNYWPSFYVRRALRILPLYLTTLIVIRLLFHLSWTYIACCLLFIANLVENRYRNYGPLWSLAVEEQFYLVFPLLLMLLHRRARKHIFHALLACCALSLLVSVYAEFRHPEFNFNLPFTRAWELGAGTLLAVWQSRTRSPRKPSGRGLHIVGATGLPLILTCVVFYPPAVRFPGYEAIPPVLGTLLLLLAPGSLANRLLGLRPFRVIGQISYSLYLWHWPLLSFAAIVSAGEFSPAVRAMLMLLAATAATLSYFLIETPFRTQRSATTRIVLLAYATAIAAVFFCGGLLLKTNGLAFRSPSLAIIENDMAIERPHHCISLAHSGPLLTPKCFPAPTSWDSAALLGDSHAEALADTLGRAVSRSGRQLLVLASFSCPFVRGYTRSLADVLQFAEACA
jgi:peptidoglycan/LPS O-acetylase OafA/YrhL